MKTLKKNFKKLLIILCLIPSVSHAEFRHFNDWTAAEKKRFLAYNTIAYIDYKQTREGLKTEGYIEANPLFGKNPHRDKALAVQLAATGLIYYGIGYYPENKTNNVLLGAIIARTAVVIHNDSIGLSWRAAF